MLDGVLAGFLSSSIGDLFGNADRDQSAGKTFAGSPQHPQIDHVLADLRGEESVEVDFCSAFIQQLRAVLQSRDIYCSRPILTLTRSVSERRNA